MPTAARPRQASPAPSRWSKNDPCTRPVTAGHPVDKQVLDLILAAGNTAQLGNPQHLSLSGGQPAHVNQNL